MKLQQKIEADLSGKPANAVVTTCHYLNSARLGQAWPGQARRDGEREEFVQRAVRAALVLLLQVTLWYEV